MADGDAPPTNLVALRERREHAIALLQKSYADDVIDVDELERRMEAVHKATTVAAITKVTADLVGPEPETVPARPTAPGLTALVPVEQVPHSKNVVCVFSGVERRGPWTVPRTTRIFTMFGGAELDFREAKLAPGPNHIKVLAAFGGVDIIVPPDMHVTVDGAAVFGGFGDTGGVAPEPDPAMPSLHISGFAMFGGVDVNARYPGESSREARKRLKRERKELEAKRRAELEARKQNQLGPHK